MNVFHFSMGVGMYAIQLADGCALHLPTRIALNTNDFRLLNREHHNFLQATKARVVSISHVGPRNPSKIWYALKPILYMLIARTTVLHIQLTGTYVENLVTFRLAKALGLTIVGTIHDATFHPGDGMKLKQIRRHIQAIELCDLLIVHGASIKEKLCSSLGIDPEMVHVVPHGSYDIYLKNQTSELTEKKNSQILLFGRMKKYKGVEVFIQAAQIVHEHYPQAEFVLAGRGEELDKFLPTIQNQAHFKIIPNRITDKQVSELFRDAEIIAIPYLEASQSGPLNLAFSFGKPIIASRVGAIPEVLAHQQEGILVEPGDAYQLAQAIMELLSDENKRFDMGVAARKKAESLSWENVIAPQTIEVYRKAIQVKKEKKKFKNCNSSERWKMVLNYYNSIHE